MSVTIKGLVFDNPAEASKYTRMAKTALYSAGWKYWELRMQKAGA